MPFHVIFFFSVYSLPVPQWLIKNLIEILVWTKLRSQKTSERFVADHEEEYEDSMGNVIPKKTYEDLRRQGLL
jgi:hypothetical protein